MKFIDEAHIEVMAGDGGTGVVSFRREKFIPRGGPDGGDGGRGGSIYAVADRNINTLVDFRYARKHLARGGERGRGSDQYGKAAEDITLRMPVGTMIYDEDTGELMFDLATHGQVVLLAKGGEGGLGNIHFKSSTNRAPRQSTSGIEGEHRRLKLELKVLADVGLLGMPNAGKSTFINQITNTKAKVGDYAFTTLTPQLGVVRHRNREFVLADIPGLIEGAAEGAGIGDRFLGHIERCRVLIHLIDVHGTDPAEALHVIEGELEAYGAGLDEKPRLIALNKIDLVDAELVEAFTAELKAAGAERVFPISGATGKGMDALLDAVLEYLPAATVTERPDGEQEEGEEQPWSPV